MSALPTAFIVLPAPGENTVERIQRKTRLLALRSLLTWPLARLQPATQVALRALRSQLTGLLKARPDRVLDAIGNPDVLCPLLVLTGRIDGQDPDALVRSAVPPLVATLAGSSAAGTGVHLRWDLPVSAVADCRRFRVVHFDPPIDALVATPEGLAAERDGEQFAVLQAGGVTETHPFVRISDDHPRLHLSLYDSNPLSMFELHPDKDGNAISLGDRDIEEWLTGFRTALSIIEASIPEWHAEALHSMDRIVPVGYMPERHLSASYREAPGLVYATLCDTPMTLAEALIHETQHGKLNALSWVDDIVFNGHDVWIDSPVRPDLRPLWGVLLAAHAFVPVAAMYDRLSGQDHPITTEWDRFATRRAEVLEVNDQSVRAVVEHSDSTVLGRRLITEMATLHRTLMARAPEPPSHPGDVKVGAPATESAVTLQSEIP